MTEPKKTPVVKEGFKRLAKVEKEFDESQKEFVRNTLAPTLDLEQVRLFILRCQNMGLNPLEGEAHAYKTHTKVQGKKVPKMVMIVSRDAKRRKAFESGKLKSITTEAIYVAKRKLYSYEIELENEEKKVKRAEEDFPAQMVQVEPWEGGKLWGAKCVIRRKDFDSEFEVTVPLGEYNRKNSIWRNKPETMIKKVAESQCLSYAFPELVGVYDSAEMPEGETETEIEGAEEPATENQKETIKKLGGEEKDMTKAEAKNLIKELAKGDK